MLLVTLYSTGILAKRGYLFDRGQCHKNTPTTKARARITNAIISSTATRLIPPNQHRARAPTVGRQDDCRKSEYFECGCHRLYPPHCLPVERATYCWLLRMWCSLVSPPTSSMHRDRPGRFTDLLEEKSECRTNQADQHTETEHAHIADQRTLLLHYPVENGARIFLLP